MKTRRRSRRAAPWGSAAALASALLALLPPAAAGQTATLVRDLTQGRRESVELGGFREIAAVPGRVFFAATTGDGENEELWASDGTAEGTVLLADACPGACGSDPRVLGQLGGLVLWAARSTDGNAYLWRSDGTREGTFRLAEEPVRFNGDTLLGERRPISSVAGGRLYFLLAAAGGDELWRTDGTRAGTQAVDGLGDRQIGDTLLADGGRVFVVTHTDFRTGPLTWSVWASDGTAAGTREVADLGEAWPLQPQVAGGRLFFVARDGFDGSELWASDGSPAGTGPVTDFAAPGPFGNPDFSEILRVSGGRLFFVADDVIHGQELYTSDGTAAGTRRITDFGFDEPGFERLANLGGRVVFTADDGLGQAGLWTTDGDPASTRFLPLPCGDDCHGTLLGFVKVGRRLVILEQANFGVKMLATDGTPAGSHLLRVCRPGTFCDVDLPAGLPVEVAALPFAVGQELWVTDGTPAGTRRRATLREVSDLDSYREAAAGPFTLVFATYRDLPALWALGPGRGAPRLVTAAAANGPGTFLENLAPLGDRLAFTACLEGELALWRSDGSAAGTAAAAVLSPRVTSDCLAAVDGGDLVSLGGSRLAFLLRASHAKQLWGSDGTPAGTGPLTPESVAVQGRLVAAGAGRLYFAAAEGETVSVWASDGTPGGTVRLAAWPAEEGGPSGLAAVGGDLYFTFGGNDRELWRSDGTPAGTGKVADLGGSFTSVPADFTGLGPAVYFVARGPRQVDEVWRSDRTSGGTAGGTRPLGAVAGMDTNPYPTELTAFGGSLYFFAWVERDVRGLWRSDGTAAGTVLLARFPAAGSPASPAAHQLTAAAGRLFFVASDGSGPFNTELWTSDGSAAGTRVVRDVNPGNGSSRPDHLTAAGGRLFFTAAEGVHGRELWVSDGTAAGTRLVQDIAPFSASSAPAHLTAAGSRLYFTADDGAFGRELWSLPLAGPAGCQPAATRLCLGGGRYQVEAAWRIDPPVELSRSGHGTAVPLTGDTGYFWFFDPANVEVVVKVLDGRGLNGHVWVFYGALSDVDYTLTVTDTQTGLTRRYHNPPGRLASVGDTQGFGPLGAFAAAPEPATVETPPSPPLSLSMITERVDPAATTPCQPAPRRLCLNGGRFAVEVAWKDFQGGTGAGTAVPLTADTGTFWFFDAANVELVVKVLDGRGLNGKFWLFYGALSNVEYTLTVTDTMTGTVKTYRNPSGRFGSVADTGAF